MNGYERVVAVLTHFAAVRPDAGQCWPWPRARDRDGYGVIQHGGRQWRAHRLALLVATGDDPGSLVVRHDCDNPPCIRPSHLRTGTALDNARDRRERGGYNFGRRTVCPDGHAISGENMYVRTDGGTQCRTCVNRKARERRARLKLERERVGSKDPDDAGADFVAEVCRSLRQAQGVRLRGGDVTETYLEGGAGALRELIEGGDR